jgi:hypothetical protein
LLPLMLPLPLPMLQPVLLLPQGLMLLPPKHLPRQWNRTLPVNRS